jgi:hypothetical protein
MKAGKTYATLNTRGPARLTEVNLYVEILPVGSKGRRWVAAVSGNDSLFKQAAAKFAL